MTYTKDPTPEKESEWALMSELCTVMMKWSNASDDLVEALKTSTGAERVKQEFILGTLCSCLNDVLDVIEATDVERRVELLSVLRTKAGSVTDL